MSFQGDGNVLNFCAITAIQLHLKDTADGPTLALKSYLGNEPLKIPLAVQSIVLSSKLDEIANLFP